MITEHLNILGQLQGVIVVGSGVLLGGMAWKVIKPESWKLALFHGRNLFNETLLFTVKFEQSLELQIFFLKRRFKSLVFYAQFTKLKLEIRYLLLKRFFIHKFYNVPMPPNEKS